MKESSQPDFSPVYLRLSVTDRCNLRCQYCRPAQGSPPPGRHQSSVENPKVPPIARASDTEFLSASEALDRLAESFEYLGPAADTPTARRHRLLVDGREWTVGLITTMSRPFCEDCDRVRLDCRGHLYSCLRSKSGVDLLTPWRASI